MMKQLAVCVLSPALICGVSYADDPIFFENSGQTLGNSNSTSVALGDLDGDGDLDAIVANGRLFSAPDDVWINDGMGFFTNSGQALGNSNSTSVALGDLDGDGDLDAIFTDEETNQPNTVWINDGNGTFINSEQSLGKSHSTSVALGDLDGDGDLDATITNTALYPGWPNFFYTNDGTGNFTFFDPPGNIQSQSNSVALGDLDGDGDLDAMVANNGWNTVLTNDGTETLTDTGQTLGFSNSSSVALGDLDGDGDLDAMVTNFSDANTVWTNDGNGNFTNSGQAFGNYNSYSVALGDIDGDGDLDAIVANLGYPGDPNIVWLNDGTGTFTNSEQALGNSQSTSIALGDLDGDGDLDAIVANWGIQVARNTVWFNQQENCSADVTGDGNVNGADLAQIISFWKTSNSEADLNSDGVVDGADLTLILSSWGSCE